MRSCLSKLLEQQDFILRAIEDGSQVDVIYCDFEKGFNKKGLKILEAKLKHFGIKGTLLNWIKNFINGRKFSVKVNNKFQRKKR